MPYKNSYNQSISQQLRDIDQNHINRIQAISETNQFDITSPLEGMVLVNEKLKGGSGYSASTVQDLGFEPTDGVTPATGGKMRRSRKNLSGSGTSGGNATIGSGISGGALLTLRDMDSMHGQPPPGRKKKTAPTASPHKDQPIPMPAQGSTLNGPAAISGSGTSGGASGSGVSGGRRGNARNALVSKIMKENNMSLPQASKYIKENNLYTR